MAAGLNRIEREPLWDLAHAQLREGLLAGRFPPGASLTLRYLAEVFGVSVTPVRDAVNRLIAQGVLQQGPRNSAIVPHLTAAELADLTVVRCALEGRAAREAARRRDGKSIQRLESRLATMRLLIQQHEFDSYLDHHRQFHSEMYAMSGIPVLTQTIENMWLRCGPALSFVIREYALSSKGRDHHKAALDGIRNGDADEAEVEIVADITEAARYLGSLADETGKLRAPGQVKGGGGR